MRATPPTSLRSDVRLHRQNDHLYVFTAHGTFRLPAPDDTVEGPISWRELPAEFQTALRERDLLLPTSSERTGSTGEQFTRAPVVVGSGATDRAIAASLARSGHHVRHADDEPHPGVLVLPLGLPEPDLRRWTTLALDRDIPIVTHFLSAAKVFLATLRPPRTACPLCLTTRIRATRPAQDVAHLPLDVLLGACSDTGSPSAEAAVALVAHRALRATHRDSVCADESPGTTLVELDLDTATQHEHPAPPLPGCTTCSAHSSWTPAPLGPGIPRESRSLADCLRRMSRAVDPLTGIVAELREDAVPAEDAWGCTVAATVGGTNTKRFSAAKSSILGGSGKLDPLEAKVCALGEAFERYAGGIHDPAHVRRASLAELGEHAVDPRDLPLGSEREYARSDVRLVPYRPDLVIDWLPMTNLRTGEDRYLPARAVHVPFPAPPEERLSFAISTGLAAGSSRHQALLGGLLEIIERDAFAICWLNRLTVPTLDLDPLPAGPTRTILDRMRHEGVEVIAKDITTDLGVPAVLFSGRFERHGMRCAVQATRADLDFSSALFGAAQELALSMSQLSSLAARRGVPDEPARFRDMWDCPLFYCREDRHSRLDFLRSGPLREIPDTSLRGHPESDVDTIVERLHECGHQVFARDITPIDVARHGVTVTRCLVPGLQPLSFAPTFRYLGGRRVYEAPVAMGARSAPLDEERINLDPTPMP